MGHNKRCSKREVYSNTILPQETRKISNKQPILTPKATISRKKNKQVFPRHRAKYYIGSGQRTGECKSPELWFYTQVHSGNLIWKLPGF